MFTRLGVAATKCSPCRTTLVQHCRAVSKFVDCKLHTPYTVHTRHTSLADLAGRTRLRTRRFSTAVDSQWPNESADIVASGSTSFDSSLENSDSPNATSESAPEENTQEAEEPPLHRLSTLDRTRLTPADCVRLHEGEFVRLECEGFEPADVYFERRGAQGKSVKRFPSGWWRGFFYHHSELNLPLAAGQIRFRITNSEDTALFDKGTDLHGPDGLPWSLPVYLIALNPAYASLQQLLLKDGIVSEELLEHIREKYPKSWIDSPPFFVVHSLGEIFAVPPKRKVYGMWIVGAHAVANLKFHTTFLGPGPFKTRHLYLRGSAHVSLHFDRERSAFYVHIHKMPERIQGERIIPQNGHTEDLIFEEWYGNPAAALSLLLPDEDVPAEETKPLIT